MGISKEIVSVKTAKTGISAKDRERLFQALSALRKVAENTFPGTDYRVRALILAACTCLHAADDLTNFQEVIEEDLEWKLQLAKKDVKQILGI